MSKQWITWGCLLGLALGQVAWALDSGLVGWWKMDETTGLSMSDASNYDNHGTVEIFSNSNTKWVKGPEKGNCLYLDGNAFVVIPIGSVIASLSDCTIASWFYWTGEETWERVFDFGSGTLNYMCFTPRSNHEVATFAIRTRGVETTENLTTDVLVGWHHVAVTIDSQAATMTLYIDGEQEDQKANMQNKLSNMGYTQANWLGRSQFSNSIYHGYVDDLFLFNRVLSEEEIQTLKSGNFGQEYAAQPAPADVAEDVLQDTTLSWASGAFANQHRLYLADSFEEVNEIDPDGSSPIGPGNVDTNNYDPGRLEFGRTYYWRVDEVNAAPDKTVFVGDVWSFTVEPEAAAIPSGDITATASSYSSGQGPEKTIDGSGLEANDAHSTELTDMWLTAIDDSLPCWIQYEFAQPYCLQSMQIWNYNGESFLAIIGSNQVIVEHSTDGVNWTALNDGVDLPMATGTPAYTSDISIDLGQVVAQYVKLTIQSNHAGGFYSQSGLSEVRLLALPLTASHCEPQTGATGIELDASLTWRAGRQAASHQVYLDADEQAVTQGTAPVHTTLENCLDLSAFDLQLNRTYYWRVDEVNDTETPSVWSGKTRSFTTTASIVVEDFESYHNLSPNMPFQIWLDGLGYTEPEPGYSGNDTGAIIGHDIWSGIYEDGFLMENLIVHGGSQSLPFYYDNTSASLPYSQTDRTFSPTQDWTQHNVTTLAIQFYGHQGNRGQLYAKINDTTVPYSGSDEDLGVEEWTQWDIDLSTVDTDLTHVTTLSIGIEDNDANGILYLDDIVLQ